jgi:hypothetical protein
LYNWNYLVQFLYFSISNASYLRISTSFPIPLETSTIKNTYTRRKLNSIISIFHSPQLYINLSIQIFADTSPFSEELHHHPFSALTTAAATQDPPHMIKYYTGCQFFFFFFFFLNFFFFFCIFFYRVFIIFCHSIRYSLIFIYCKNYNFIL